MFLRIAPLLFCCLCACRASAPFADPAPDDLGGVVEAYAGATGATVSYARGVRELLESAAVQRVVRPDGDRIEVGPPRLDPPGPALAVEVLPLRYAEARATAALVDELLLHDARRVEPRPRIVPDPRTNVLVVAADAGLLARVKRLVGLIDVEAGQG